MKITEQRCSGACLTPGLTGMVVLNRCRTSASLHEAQHQQPLHGAAEVTAAKGADHCFSPGKQGGATTVVFLIRSAAFVS